MALLGPSGCGKSTILNMVAGLLPRSGGRILIDEDAVEPGKVNRKVGYVFQRDTVFPGAPSRPISAMAWRSQACRRRSARRASPRRSRPPTSPASAESFPRTLSGGMRQRVALMRTLIMEPEILLMDEPFGALDTHTKLEMHATLLEIWERERQTVLFVTHDLGEALTLASRIILLSARPGGSRTISTSPSRGRATPWTCARPRNSAGFYSRIWHSLGEEFRRTKADAPVS